jgi:uncharacterized protein
MRTAIGVAVLCVAQAAWGQEPAPAPPPPQVRETKHPGGQLKERFELRNGKKDGAYVSYYAHCQISIRGQYKADQKDGKWTMWRENGRKVSEGTYANGKREGVWAYYDKNGQKQFEGPFVDDNGHGTFTEWFANGNKWRTFEVKDGRRVGPEPEACAAKKGDWVVDYEAREEGCKVEDVAQGPWSGYYGTGPRRWRAEVEGGRYQGVYEEFHPGGQVMRRGQYVNGIPDGTHEFKGPDGAVYGSSTIAAGNGKWRAYHPDGKVASEGEYRDGAQSGAWRTYYEGGALADETTYVNGLPDGPYRSWYKTTRPPT